jgi:predicted permease
LAAGPVFQGMIDQLFRDIRFACRQLWKTKSFLAVAVLTLALGIGANTAIFTLIDAVMLKSLPVSDPKSLIRLGDGDNCCVIGGNQSRFSIFSYPLYTYLHDNTAEFDQLAGFQAGVGKVGVRRGGDSGPSEPFSGQFVSGNYFATFGIRASAGRLMSPNDDVRGNTPVAVMSYRTWQHYGGDPAIVGSTFIIDGVPFTIAGVTARDFFGDSLRPDPPDFWMPLSSEPIVHKAGALLDHGDGHWLYVIGRIKPATSLPAVEAKINNALQQWFNANQPPHNDNERKTMERQHITLTPAGGGVSSLRQNYQRDLTLLLMITTVVLLIACANVANLQLARSASNTQQMAIRAALGARRVRVIRQVLTECIVLAVIGGIAGLLVAMALSRLLISLAFSGATYIPIGTVPDLSVMTAAFILALLSGTVFGIAPAWSASRTDPAESLRRKGRSASCATSRLQRSLVLLQAALSLMLLASAGLMVQTVRNLQNQQFGFNLNGISVVNVNAGFGSYSPERLQAIYQSIDDRLRKIRGVNDVAMTLYSPMSGNNWQSGVAIEDVPNLHISPSWDRVSPGFVHTIGARIIKGRDFNERDNANSTHVAIVNQAFVDKVFSNGDPIGKRFGLGGLEHRADYQIVGVVNNVLFRYPRQPEVPPMFFVPFLQMSEADWHNSTMARSNLIGSILLKVAPNSASIASQLQTALADVDTNLTILSTVTMQDLLDEQVQHERLIARLAVLLGVLALALASIGLYGITSYAVVRRTGEIGVRSALGATRSMVVRLVLGEALAQISLGLLFGVPAALFAGRMLAEQLYQVNSTDPSILLGSCIVVLLSGAAAGIVPALRASGVDPVIALRSE